jgi:hypothetical protein
MENEDATFKEEKATRLGHIHKTSSNLIVP